jgi:hypothetical protein
MTTTVMFITIEELLGVLSSVWSVPRCHNQSESVLREVDGITHGINIKATVTLLLDTARAFNRSGITGSRAKLMQYTTVHNRTLFLCMESPIQGYAPFRPEHLREDYSYSGYFFSYEWDNVSQPLEHDCTWQQYGNALIPPMPPASTAACCVEKPLVARNSFISDNREGKLIYVDEFWLSLAILSVFQQAAARITLRRSWKLFPTFLFQEIPTKYNFHYVLTLFIRQLKCHMNTSIPFLRLCTRSS